MPANTFAAKTMNKYVSFERGLWQRQTGWLAPVPKRRVFGRVWVAVAEQVGLDAAIALIRRYGGFRGKSYEVIMKAQIHEFWLQDHQGQVYWPDDLTDFCAIADMKIGPDTGVSGDIFTLSICSPKWLASNILRPKIAHKSHEQRHELAFGRHYLFAEEYDPEKIRQAVEGIVNDTKGSKWSEMALHLSRYFAWEYEDFQQT